MNILKDFIKVKFIRLDRDNFKVVISDNIKLNINEVGLGLGDELTVLIPNVIVEVPD